MQKDFIVLILSLDISGAYYYRVSISGDNI